MVSSWSARPGLTLCLCVSLQLFNTTLAGLEARWAAAAGELLAPTQLAASSSVVTTVVGRPVVGFVDVMSNHGTRYGLHHPRPSISRRDSGCRRHRPLSASTDDRFCGTRLSGVLARLVKSLRAWAVAE